MLTRQDDPTVLIKALRYLHDYTAQIPFFTTNMAELALRATNAFNEPNSTHRLILPSRLRHLSAGQQPEVGYLPEFGMDFSGPTL
jgi:hypothetical protein